jgi:pimeloyl-ACP methyl ester carboxylesterase
MSEDLLELINDHQLEEVIIIGHSMGGKTAMHFTLNHPEKVSKLIVVDIAPKQYPVHHQKILDALNVIDLEKIKSRKEAEEILSKYIGDFGTKQFLLKNLYWKENGEEKGLAWRFNLPVIDKNIEIVGQENVAVAVAPNIPVLFIRGERSDYIQPQDETLIKRMFPKSMIKTVPNTGHWVQADNPDGFLNAVKDFLEQK